jgi:hypothetical protein
MLRRGTRYFVPKSTATRSTRLLSPPGSLLSAVRMRTLFECSMRRSRFWQRQPGSGLLQGWSRFDRIGGLFAFRAKADVHTLKGILGPTPYVCQCPPPRPLKSCYLR